MFARSDSVRIYSGTGFADPDLESLSVAYRTTDDYLYLEEYFVFIRLSRAAATAVRRTCEG